MFQGSVGVFLELAKSKVQGMRDSSEFDMVEEDGFLPWSFPMKP